MQGDVLQGHRINVKIMIGKDMDQTQNLGMDRFSKDAFIFIITEQQFLEVCQIKGVSNHLIVSI